MSSITTIARGGSGADEGKKRLQMAGLVAALALSGIFAANELVSGSSRGIALAIAAVIAPIGLYLSIRRPLIFPFGLYAILVPFNNLVFISGLGTLTKLAGILSSVALLFYMIRMRSALRPSGALFAWLAFVAWACASVFWAIDPSQSIVLIGTLAQLLLLYAITALVPVTVSDLRFILAAISIGGICAAAYGAYLFAHGSNVQGNRLFLESATNTDHLDPNHFAASLLLPLGIVMMAALSARNRLLKVPLIACTGVIMIGVYAGASRGAFVAVVAMAAYLIWRSRYRAQMIFIALVGALASLAVPTALWSRILADLATGSGRSSIWMIGLDAFRRHWLLGAGMANFPIAYNESFLRFYSPVVAKWDRGAHDLPIMVAVEFGVVGLALLAWVIVSQFRQLNRIRPGEPLYDIRIGLEAGFVGLLVAALFLDVLYWKYAWLTFMALALARSASLIAAGHRPNARSETAAVFQENGVRGNGARVQPVNQR